MSYGKVTVRLRTKERKNDGTQEILKGELLEFTTIPVIDSEDESKTRFIIYGIVETEDGRFLGRQLSEIRRLKDV